MISLDSVELHGAWFLELSSTTSTSLVFSYFIQNEDAQLTETIAKQMDHVHVHLRLQRMVLPKQ